jgi:hypothetical protein
MPAMTGTRSSTATAAVTALALLLASTTPAFGADQELLVRAVGQPPGRELVSLLARSAEPRTILLAEHPDYAGLTYSALAEKFCGAVPDGYLDELRAINPGQTIDLVALAGSAAFSVKWPACFEVRNNVTYKIRKNDNPTAIRLSLTGEFAAGPELDTYFQSSGINPRTAILKPGTTLQLPFQTLKTRIRIPSGQVAAFMANLKTVAGRRAQVEIPRSSGTLIGSLPAGATLGTDQDCTYETDERYPFAALEVANAYDALKGQQNAVYVTVVDNGFFGVPCSAAACPGSLSADGDFSPRFPRQFFAKPSFYTSYGSTLGVNYVLEPLNYRDLQAADVNDISGHGTHVAGLVLGGPTFERHRQQLLVDGSSGTGRIELSILAVARGTLELDSQTEARIKTAVDAMVSPMLVNMSIAFDEPDAEGAFNKLLEENKILFVAAAGNGHEDLGEHHIYPAALGGKGRANLITVASIDSTGKLSAFSNYGEAVDIAAPGCKISSWLDAEGSDIPLSGTSQAAPLVTFAASLLLAKLQPITPRAIKNRLIYSGDLIQNAAGRRQVWSHTRLAIPKALFVHDDFLFVREGPGFGAYLGDIERFTGVACAGKERDFDDIRSLKRISPSEVMVYTETSSGPVSVCPGKLADHTVADPTVPVTLTFHVRSRLQGASVLDPSEKTLTFNAADLIELVRKMPD